MYNSVPPATWCRVRVKDGIKSSMRKLGNTQMRQTDYICAKLLICQKNRGRLEIYTHRPRRAESPSAGWSGRYLHFEGHGSSSDECSLVSGLTSGFLNVTCFFRGGKKEKGLFNFWKRASVSTAWHNNTLTGEDCRLPANTKNSKASDGWEQEAPWRRNEDFWCPPSHTSSLN